MKRILCLLTALCLLLFNAAGAEKEEENKMSPMLMTINGTAVTVDLKKNAAVTELMALLAKDAVTVSTHGYGGWEQVGGLGFSLPAEDTWLTAQPGDVMLYCGSQIVLFYGTNSWDYTPLGHIRDKTAEELKDLLGSGTDTVILSLMSEN